MFNLQPFQEFLKPFGWFLTLGKGDTDQIKGEIDDLLQHSSQSLRSLIELGDTLEDIPLAQFTEQGFWRIANHCFWFFTSPQASQKARTHCTDIERDVARINFKVAKLLRTEGGDWKGINDAFRTLMDADHFFLNQYEQELASLGNELQAIGDLLMKDAQAAWQRYDTLRSSLAKSRQGLSNEIANMQKAQTHIHKLLT